jgi:hypothetical protein
MERRLFTCLLLALPLLMLAVRDVRGQIVTPTDPACLAVRTAPRLVSADVVGPQTLDAQGNPPFGWNPDFARLSRGTIHYVSANYVHVKIVTDRCAQIDGVSVGARVLTPTNVDGFWYFTQAADVPGHADQIAYSVMVHFPYGREGSTDLVTVVVGRVFRLSDTTSYSFQLVRVKSVEAQAVSAPFGFSEAEVFNMFGKALYEAFNREQNSTVITKDNGERVRVYAYDPKQMSLRVDSTGITFSFKFKIDKTCQPTAQVQGRFRLNADINGISVAWVVSPYANLQWPAWCEIATGIPGLGQLIDLLFFSGAEGEVGAGVQGRIEQAIASFLPNDPTINLLLDGSSTRSDELLINLRLNAPSVKIQVPYDAFDMSRSSTAFRFGETFRLVASGLSVEDSGWRGDWDWAVPATIRLGSHGIPRFATVDWHNPLTLSRYAGLLPRSELPVGRLLARRSTPLTTTTYAYTPGCLIQADSAVPTAVRIRFGVNDTVADAQRLRPNWAHGYWLRIFFVQAFLDQRACQPSIVQTGPTEPPTNPTP